jgi:RNase P/RNase MRP subunit POP5
MSRLIFVPQYPAKMRYQEWWLSEFSKNFWQHYDNVIVLGIRTHFGIKDQPHSSKIYDENSWNDALKSDAQMFSPIDASIKFELEQIQEYMELKLELDDTLFLADLSFPGFFTNVLHHRRPRKCYAFCHATSLNTGDYFENVRRSKWLVECGQSSIFDKVFVGSRYHYNKLTELGLIVSFNGNKLKIIGLPNPSLPVFKEEKKYNIISVARPSYQKVNQEIEEKVEREFGKIVRKECNTWEEYYKFVSSGRVLLSSAREETYGYQVVDAILNNTIPLAPDAYSYPELLPRRCLYKNFDELKNLLYSYLLESPEGYRVPDLGTKADANCFYERLVLEMKG